MGISFWRNRALQCRLLPGAASSQSIYLKQDGKRVILSVNILTTSFKDYLFIEAMLLCQNSTLFRRLFKKFLLNLNILFFKYFVSIVISNHSNPRNDS